MIIQHYVIATPVHLVCHLIIMLDTWTVHTSDGTPRLIRAAQRPKAFFEQKPGNPLPGWKTGTADIQTNSSAWVGFA